MKRSLLILVLFALATVPFASAAEPTVAALVDSYRHPQLGEQVAVKEYVLTAGHARFVLNGAAAPIKAGEDVIGLYFQGDGTLEYTSVEPLEATVMTLNTRRASGLKAEPKDGGLLVRASFKRMAYYTSEALPELKGSVSPGGLSIGDHLALFARDTSTPASHLLALQKLNDRTKKVVRAELAGGGDSLVYVYDEVESRRESLINLHRSDDRSYAKYLFPAILSEQPIGWSFRQPVPPPIALTAIDYTLIASGDRDAKLTITETLVPYGRAARAIRLSLLNNQYGTSASDERTYKVNSVKDAAGKDLPFAHDHDEIIIGLPSPAAAGRELKLTFDIEGDFLIRPNGDSFWQLGTFAWFPQPDLGGQFYTVHSVVKVKKPFIAFAPGDTLRREVEGEYNVIENRIDKPVQFAVVLAGKYAFEQETENGLTIRVATYAGKNDIAMRKLLNLTRKMVEFYEPFLGPFPFREFNIIEINQWGYGQAPPATMFITQEAFKPLSGEINQFFSQGINERFAHEIAHQYWGHVVKMPSGEEQWITESFAEYSAALVVQQLKGKGGYNALVATWKGNSSGPAKQSSILLANRLATPNNYDGYIARTYLVYDKGAYLLSRVHKEVGDDVFLTYLRSAQGTFAWKFGSTKGLIGLLNHVTKKDYTKFFEDNFYGTGMPK